MIRHLIKLFTVAILLLNFGCVYSTDSSTVGYKASFVDSASLCRYVDPKSLQEVIKLDVPYISQKPNYCGPASVAMILQYMGDTVTQDQIGAGIVDSKGTSPSELRAKVESLGYNFSAVSCGFNNLLSLLQDGKPVMVRIMNKTKDNGHYIVVTGFDMNNNVIYVNDSEDKTRTSISFDNFKTLWDINTLDVDANSYNLMIIISR